MHLKDLRSPKDIKNFSIGELETLAGELREKIISHVAVHGGHLASSLGVIELTLAMHFVYNTPDDIIVWDVGHQAYVHKLLTGRYDRFDTLRKKGGLSGFLKRTESPYDAFGAGHASTSISAALGFAVARDLLGKKNNVVAVIGDGAMTGGMAFEALNNAGLAKQNMTIILNDNKMSIAPNVGGFSRYLNRVISDPKYNKLRNDVDKMMRRIPGLLGERFRELLGVGEDALKSVLKPGRLFEDLGIRYFGPIDGHNLPELIEMLDRVKAIPGPCLLHVVSEKGRGLKLAENDPYKWHASVPFDPESGTALTPGSSKPTLTTVFGKAMLELAKADKRIVGITGAMPAGCGLNIVEKELPGRVIDVGIAEEHAITFAAGMACEGVIPVCAIYSSFLQRAYDQMVHDVALQHLHVVFVLDRAGLVGADGPTHHGNLDLSFMRTIPGMVVMAPSDENELRDMLYTAIQHKDGPIALRYPRGNAYAEQTRPGFNALEIGKFRVVEEGREILLLGAGFMLAELAVTARILRENGYAPTLVDARFIKPLDTEGYRSLFQNHSVVVTLEDNSIVGGFGSAIAELLADLGLTGHQLFRFGLPDSFVEHGEIAELFQSLGIDGTSLAHSIMDRLAASHRENT